MKKLRMYTDGAARGNPGPAGAGWLIQDAKGAVLTEGKQYLGELTNNQAEYRALLLALKEVVGLHPTSLEIFADSELMIRQLKGEYKVKNEGLRPLYDEVLLTLRKIPHYSLCSIPREKNEGADRLANQAIDESVL